MLFDYSEKKKANILRKKKEDRSDNTEVFNICFTKMENCVNF